MAYCHDKFLASSNQVNHTRTAYDGDHYGEEAFIISVSGKCTEAKSRVGWGYIIEDTKQNVIHTENGGGFRGTAWQAEMTGVFECLKKAWELDAIPRYSTIYLQMANKTLIEILGWWIPKGWWFRDRNTRLWRRRDGQLAANSEFYDKILLATENLTHFGIEVHYEYVVSGSSRSEDRAQELAWEGRKCRFR
eukprot:GHVU01164919.1.p1 GENE.GHVU01164919.1~~GHVU01164919.1.p1  ORF type:complete len:192 (+),score=18.91 GHVU01164919.1:226-801(+)